MPALGLELLMRADLHDSLPVEYDDEVGHSHSGKPVRHEDCDLAGITGAPGRLGVAFEQHVFRFGVERGGGLVQEQEQRVVAHKTPRESQFLPLSERHLDTPGPVGAQLRLKAGGESGDDFAGAGTIDCGYHRALIVQPGHIT